MPEIRPIHVVRDPSAARVKVLDRHVARVLDELVEGSRVVDLRKIDIIQLGAVDDELILSHLASLPDGTAVAIVDVLRRVTRERINLDDAEARGRVIAARVDAHRQARVSLAMRNAAHERAKQPPPLIL